MATKKKAPVEAVSPDTEAIESRKEKELRGIVDGTDRLNIRSGPSIDNNVVKIVEIGTEFNLIEDAADAWWKVQNDTVTGYCMKQFIRIL